MKSDMDSWCSTTFAARLSLLIIIRWERRLDLAYLISQISDPGEVGARTKSGSFNK